MSHANIKLPPLTVPAALPSSAPLRHPLESLRRQIERLYSDFSGGMWPVHAGAFPEDRAPVFFHGLPLMDVLDTGDGYEVTAELPGVAQGEVELTVTDGVLRIRGERKRPLESSGKGYLLQERSQGEFERSVHLPEDVDTTKIDATLRDGLLTVHLPKDPAARKTAQKIAVKP